MACGSEGVTEYFYSGSEVIAEKQGANWTDYIFFGDQRLAKQTGATASTASYLHADHLRSTRVINHETRITGFYP